VIAYKVDTSRHPRAHELSSIGRAHQIAAVLAKNRLWHVIELLALEQLVPLPRRGHMAAPSSLITPLQLRAVLEELGPTFMKLGQMLSTRADLLPPEFKRELSALQDHAAEIPIQLVLDTVEAELGGPISKSFATFDRTPLATGSIGQAHLATRFDGTEVVVKVRRPGAVEQIDEDLKLMHRLAAIASGHIGSAAGLDLVAIVREFDTSLRAELDYLQEARNAERFARNFKNSPRVHIPRVFWETTTTRMLTLERIKGTRITDASALAAASIDRDFVAREAMEIVLKMMLEDGFFHADLHPGNLFIESSSRIGLIDFGMVGTLDAEAEAGLGQMLIAFAERDTDGMVDGLLALGMAGPTVDRAALGKDLGKRVSRYYGELGNITLSGFLDDMFGVVRCHRLTMPTALSMLAKTIVTAEGMVAQLDPGFKVIDATKPYAERLMLKRNSPQVWAGRLERAVPDMLWLATESPRLIRRTLTSFEGGQFALTVEPRGLEPYVKVFERAATRLVLGMLLSALLIAGGMVLSSSGLETRGLVFNLTAATYGGAVLLLGGTLIWLSKRRLKS
jgi:ubiquinone biosynthesis protein